MIVKIVSTKKDYSWNPSTFICKNSKSIADTSMTEYEEIIIVKDTVSKKQ